MKVIIHTYPSLGDEEKMKELRPIGRNNDAYQKTLSELGEFAAKADELGYWGLSHIEHHFHSEGLEMSPDPGLLNLYLSRFTKQIRHGQLGFVLPTHNPIRLAERIAMIDHMLQGRLFVGMTRGYQKRWVDVIGQKYGATIAHGDEDSLTGVKDNNNRALFYEHYRIMKKAWSDDLLQYKSKYYEIPNPYEGPGTQWPPSEKMTIPYGVPGEVDEEGRIQGISVVPKPYQTPHPQLFQGVSVSDVTMQWCGLENITPILMYAPVEMAIKQAQIYVNSAAQMGRNYKIGQNMGVMRVFHIGKKGDDLYKAIKKYDYPAWDLWYRSFGFLDILRLPYEEGEVPKKNESTADRLIKSKMVISGSVDDIKRHIDEMLKVVPFEYLVWHLPFGIMPKDEALEQIELFATKIMPEFGMQLEYSSAN